MKRNPLLPLHPPLTPPNWRSRAALAQTSFAARGLFRMQVCGECGAVQHPVREACFACLGDALAWRDVPRGGVLAAATVVRVSADPYFRRRMPWPVGTVVMDAGPRVQAHLLGGVAPGERVVLRQMLDKAGRSVMLAAPEGREVAEDAVLAELSCDPKGRRVLIVDGRGVAGLALARAMREAGAREVFVGVAAEWLPGADVSAFTPVALDVTDQDSVLRAVGALGGRVDILVNNAGLRLRPGGPLAAGALSEARLAMEHAYFGALRLAQAFGPALRGRAEDGAVAWVNLLSVGALAALPGWERDAPAQAAALALARSLRGMLRPLRSVTALVGPLDDVWHEAVPPPKLGGAALAAAVVKALRDGVEDLAVGDVAQDVWERWLDAPDVPARENG